MNPKIKSFINNPWFIRIVFYLLPLISITYYWKILIDFLLKNVEVPIWVLIFLPIVLILLRIYWLKVIHKKKKYIRIQADYLGYTEDNIEGILYRWYYPYSNSPIIRIKDNYCPICRCRLIKFTCPNCKKYYPNSKPIDEVDAIINSRIENKYYKTNNIT